MCLCSSSCWDAVMQNSYQLMFAFFLPRSLYIILIPCHSLFCLFALLETVFWLQRKRMHPRQWMTSSWSMAERYWRTTRHWESARALYVISLEELQPCMLLSAPPRKKELVNIICILHLGSYMQLCILNFFSLMVLWLGTEKKTLNTPKETKCGCVILWFAYLKSRSCIISWVC